jgi:hypothetical protein
LRLERLDGAEVVERLGQALPSMYLREWRVRSDFGSSVRITWACFAPTSQYSAVPVASLSTPHSFGFAMPAPSQNPFTVSSGAPPSTTTVSIVSRICLATLPG